MHQRIKLQKGHYRMFANVTFLLIYLVVILAILGTFAYAGYIAAPWVPLRKRDVERMLNLAKIKSGDTLIDLGSGDGRIIIAAAKRYGADSTGYEIAILIFLASYFKILVHRLWKKVRVYYKNFYKIDFSHADVITAFLSPHAMEKLESKAMKEMKPGSRFVSYVFHFPNWKPALVDKPESKDLKIFVYIK